MKTRILMLGLLLSLAITNCSKKDDDQDNTTITADEALINSKLDVAVDDVAKAIEDELELTQISNNDSPEALRTSSDCPVVTRSPAFGAILVSGQAVAKTIDFGTGCAVGTNVLKGKIIINYFYDPTATTRVVTYSFLEFFYNNKELNGTRTFTRTVTPTGTVVVMDMNLQMTLLTGQTITRIGSRTRTQTAGFGTPLVLADNVYQVTGNWTTTYPNNQTQTSTITTPLTIKLACLSANSPISSGIITFVRNGRTATLDYGNGSCDKTAVFTYKGVSFNIDIKAR